MGVFLLICQHLPPVCNAVSAFLLVKPNLHVFRAKFSEITQTSIRRACENLTEPDINVSDAVDVRQELDLRIGEVAPNKPEQNEEHVYDRSVFSV